MLLGYRNKFDLNETSELQEQL